MAVTPELRELAAILMSGPDRLLRQLLPAPLGALAGYPVGNVVGILSVGLLDPRVREALGFSWTWRHRAAFNALVAGIRRINQVLPERVRVLAIARRAEQKYRETASLAA